MDSGYLYAGNHSTSISGKKCYPVTKESAIYFNLLLIKR